MPFFLMKADKVVSLRNSELIKAYFIQLIKGTALSQKHRSLRHLTVENINRYIFVLNSVHEAINGHLSEVELRNKIISELEGSKSF